MMGGMIGEKEKLGISDSIYSIIFNFNFGNSANAYYTSRKI